MSFDNISKNAKYIYFKWQLKSKIILTNTICSSDRKSQYSTKFFEHKIGQISVWSNDY